MNASQLQEKLSSWRVSGDGPHSFSHSDGGWTVHVSAIRNDALAGRVWEMTLTRTGTAPAGRTLPKWAEMIASSASGLQEDLKVVEVDAARNEALLRSDAPSRRGPVATYFEVMLHGLTKAVVRRYQADLAAGTPREQVSFDITHEALAKLAGDIAA